MEKERKIKRERVVKRSGRMEQKQSSPATGNLLFSYF